jgi:branched-chain amino acid transport system ATP-binding protein
MLLQVKRLSVAYGGADVLNGVTISIDEGECVAILGPNGAGKSTLLKAIVELVPARAGEVLFKGEGVALGGVAGKPAIALLPQGKRVFPSLTVSENIEIMLHKSGWRRRRMRTDALLAMFPALKERAGIAAGRLSSGEQQMVALARAMALEPQLLLLDEPSHGLSPIWVDQVFDHLKVLRQQGVGIALVEQNVDKAAEIADRGYIMRGGQIVDETRPSEFARAVHDAGFAWAER